MFAYVPMLFLLQLRFLSVYEELSHILKQYMQRIYQRQIDIYYVVMIY